VQEERAGNLCKTFATSKISEVLVSMNSTHADHTYPLKKKTMYNSTQHMKPQLQTSVVNPSYPRCRRYSRHSRRSACI